MPITEALYIVLLAIPAFGGHAHDRDRQKCLSFCDLALVRGAFLPDYFSVSNEALPVWVGGRG